MEVSRCAKCGKTEVAIPAIEDLHRVIGRSVILKLERLMPEEIRFLRKHLGLSQADLGAHLGVSLESVSRWENGATMGVPAKRLLRFIVARRDPVQKYEQELERVALLRLGVRGSTHAERKTAGERHPLPSLARHRLAKGRGILPCPFFCLERRPVVQGHFERG
jgi:putative zinc finger/helix-turn-helix YgiT family protein